MGRSMQKVIFGLISIIILSLIACGGLVGQGTGNEESSNSDQMELDLVEAGAELSGELNDALNGMSKELRIEFNQFMDLGKSLSEKEEMLLKQLDEALYRGDEFDRLNQEMAANYQNEIENLKKTNSALKDELDIYLKQLDDLRDDLNQSMTKLFNLENNNSKLNDDIQMLIIGDTDLINQLIQKEDEIVILKDQLEQKVEDEMQKNGNSS